MTSVYVEDNDSGITLMFEGRGYKVVVDPELAGLICFSGGADVSPFLYGEPIHPATRSDFDRDVRCVQLYDRYKFSKPKVGICRGGQFLNVMNGGKLLQHVEKHAIGGTHRAMDMMDGIELNVTSTHHQMMVPSEEGRVLLAASLGGRKEDAQGNEILGNYSDTESVWYPATMTLCFQPHPEYVSRDHECQEYFFKLLKSRIGV